MIHPLITRVPAHIKIVQSRAQYQAIFNKPAPAFDYSRPVKEWIDTRELDPEEEAQYFGIRYDTEGQPMLSEGRNVQTRNFTLWPEEAARVNLLPEPVPAQGSLTPEQLRMIQRKRAWPLELTSGERVVLAPGIAQAPAIDDGKPEPSASGCQCGEVLEIVRRIEKKVAA